MTTQSATFHRKFNQRIAAERLHDETHDYDNTAAYDAIIDWSKNEGKIVREFLGDQYNEIWQTLQGDNFAETWDSIQEFSNSIGLMPTGFMPLWLEDEGSTEYILRAQEFYNEGRGYCGCGGDPMPHTVFCRMCL